MLGSQGHHPAVLDIGIRQALLQLPELEQQTSIARSPVHALNVDPVDPNRLAFNLASGWSGEGSFSSNMRRRKEGREYQRGNIRFKGEETSCADSSMHVLDIECCKLEPAGIEFGFWLVR